MNDQNTLLQTIALTGVIVLPILALALVSYVIIRHNVALADNNIRMITVCLALPLVALIAFIPETTIGDRSAVYGLIGTIAGYILGREQASAARSASAP
jgi:hypothetical protein